MSMTTGKKLPKIKHIEKKDLERNHISPDMEYDSKEENSYIINLKRNSLKDFINTKKKSSSFSGRNRKHIE